jgi:AcrR family transcriptional regulator
MGTEKPRRSDATRAAILVAARERFAADGYERATIRAIAADAGIDPAMVMRYYGNKEKLFATAAEFDLRLPDLTAVPAGEVGAVLARHFMSRWEGDETMMALLRAGVTNPAVAERVRGIFAGQLGAVVAKLCPSADDAAMRAGLVASQVLGFALCRYVLEFPPVVGMSVDEVVQWLGPTLQRYLSSSS